jgi:hypothetical protein
MELRTVVPDELSRRSSGSELTLAERIYIICRARQMMLDCGEYDVKKIALEALVSPNTVRSLLDDPYPVYSLHSTTLPKLDPRFIGPKKRSLPNVNELDDDDFTLVGLALREPRLTPRALAARMCNDEWSTDRVKHLLTAFFPYRKAIRRPPLDLQHRAARLRYFYETLPKFDATRIIWTDESYIQRTGQGFRWITEPEQRYSGVRVQKEEQYMVWAAFTFKDGLIDYRVFPKNYTMDSRRYVADCLEPCILPFWTRLSAADKEIYSFMQDNAAPHKAPAAAGCLQDNFIRVVEWPPLSPDLNPIENFWCIVKSLTNKVDLASLNGLRETDVILGAILIAFGSDRMVEMYRRMRENWLACIDADGGNHHYTA